MLEKEIKYYVNPTTCDRKKEAIDLLTIDNDDIKCIPVMTKRGPAVCRQNNLVFAAMEVTDKSTNTKKIVCKIVNTKTNLRYDKILRYEIFDESDCPEKYATCPSRILKLLSISDDDNVNNWREACRDELALLACEKNTNGSLTTLEIGAQIKLNKKSSNGAEIILEKVVDFSYKKPYWQDIETFKRFKKCDIQAIGYTILDQV